MPFKDDIAGSYLKQAFSFRGSLALQEWRLPLFLQVLHHIKRS
jgi:hypothetical protein